MDARIQTIVDDVAAQKTVIDSAVALISGFAAQLKDVTAQLQDALGKIDSGGVDLGPLVALGASLEAQTAELAQAVQANTPAAPPVVAPPAPAPDPTPAPPASDTGNPSA